MLLVYVCIVITKAVSKIKFNISNASPVSATTLNIFAFKQTRWGHARV